MTFSTAALENGRFTQLQNFARFFHRTKHSHRAAQATAAAAAWELYQNAGTLHTVRLAAPLSHCCTAGG